MSQTVNSEMTELYWQVGNAVNQDLLGSKRAEYGSQAVQKLGLARRACTEEAGARNNSATAGTSLIPSPTTRFSPHCGEI